MKKLWLLLLLVPSLLAQTITTIQAGDLITNSRAVINTNFNELLTYMWKNGTYTDVLAISTPGTSPASGYFRVYAKTGSGICWKSSAGVETCAATGSSLTDFDQSIATNTVTFLTGRARMGNYTPTSFAGSSFTGVSGTGSLVVYIDASNNLVCNPQTGVSVTVTGALTCSTVASPSFPANSIPLYTYAVAAGVPSLTTDHRAYLSSRGVSAGTGISISEASGTASVAIDTATVPQLGGSNTWTGANDFTGASSTAPMKKGTSLPATCAIGDQYFKSDATAGANLYGCTAVNTWTVQGSGVGYDPFARGTYQWVEEFNSGTLSTGQIGSLGWVTNTNVGSMSVTAEISAANHPGILRITTSAASGDDGTILLRNLTASGNGMRMDNITGWEYQFIVKPVQVTTVGHYVGLGNYYTAKGADRLVAKFDTNDSDATWKFQACASSTCTTSASTVTPSAGGWYRIRVRSTTAGTILFSVDGETEVSISTNVPSAVMNPAVSLVTRTTASSSIDVDWAAGSMTVTR